MTRRELEDLNAELIDLLAALREQIDEKLEELEAAKDDADDENDGGD